MKTTAPLSVVARHQADWNRRRASRTPDEKRRDQAQLSARLLDEDAQNELVEIWGPDGEPYMVPRWAARSHFELAALRRTGQQQVATEQAARPDSAQMPAELQGQGHAMGTVNPAQMNPDQLKAHVIHLKLQLTEAQRLLAKVDPGTGVADSARRKMERRIGGRS